MVHWSLRHWQCFWCKFPVVRNPVWLAAADFTSCFFRQISSRPSQPYPTCAGKFFPKNVSLPLCQKYSKARGFVILIVIYLHVWHLLRIESLITRWLPAQHEEGPRRVMIFTKLSYHPRNRIPTLNKTRWAPYQFRTPFVGLKNPP